MRIRLSNHSLSLVMGGCLIGFAGYSSPGWAALKGKPQGTQVGTSTVTLDQLKGWTLPETETLPFTGKLPIKGSSGSDIKGRMGDGVIYYTSMYSGQRVYKVGDKWSVDTRYADNVTGNYTFLIVKSGKDTGVRSYVAQRGRFQNQEFVLLDANSNGRFDDAGKDLLVFDKKKQLKVKVGSQLELDKGKDKEKEKEKFDMQVSPSGRTVIFGKAMAFGGAFDGTANAGGASDADGALVAWNQIRASLGVEPVRRDKAIEANGFKHIEYMKAVGKLVHPEDKNHPKYTPEGHKAGMQSDLSAGQSSAKGSLLSLMDTFFHRVALIKPEVEVVGISYDAGSRYAVVNYGGGPKRKGAKWPGPIAYPPDGATGVRPGWSGREGPSPIPSGPPQGGVGQTITLTFPPRERPKDGKLTLTDPSGKSPEGWTSTPEKPAASMFRTNMNTICFIAKQPLESNTKYKVKVEATVNGKPYLKEWSFTTGENTRRGWGGRKRRR